MSGIIARYHINFRVDSLRDNAGSAPRLSRAPYDPVGGHERNKSEPVWRTPIHVPLTYAHRFGSLSLALHDITARPAWVCRRARCNSRKNVPLPQNSPCEEQRHRRNTRATERRKQTTLVNNSESKKRKHSMHSRVLGSVRGRGWSGEREGGGGSSVA